MPIVQQFEKVTSFPKCLGAIDGKHIYINAPNNSGSVFFNHKNRFSVVLFILAYASYRILYYCIGHRGAHSDSTIFENSQLGNYLCSPNIVPEHSQLPGRTVDVPYVILADSAFALRPHILRPYHARLSRPDHINIKSKLSAAQRVVECTFGILGKRFRVLLHCMGIQPKRANLIVGACVTLHNWLRHIKFTEEVNIPFDLQTELQHRNNNKTLFILPQNNTNNQGQEMRFAELVRTEFREYLLN